MTNTTQPATQDPDTYEFFTIPYDTRAHLYRTENRRGQATTWCGLTFTTWHQPGTAPTCQSCTGEQFRRQLIADELNQARAQLP
jgi:hypothetical protein